jgi:broad-specificity NMP kinase
MRIAVVGVCGSGKSELVRRLRARGLGAYAVAQEHSHVPDLWRHEAEPDLLVYLSATARTVRQRGHVSLTGHELREQRRRLAEARRHAHLQVRTDRLSPEQVEQAVLDYLAGLAGAEPRGARPDILRPSMVSRR